MKDIFKILITASLAVLLTACGGGGGTPLPVPDTTVYVDAVNGNDGNAGTINAPFKTITFALAAAGPNKTIMVQPGTYDAAGNGEVFPLVLQANQALIGDVANKGAGVTPTKISGSGVSALGALGGNTAIVGAAGAQVSGFTIGDVGYTLSYAAIKVDGITMQISNNTFNNMSYAGIDLSNNGTSIIENNVFDTASYGVYASACTNAPIVRNNTFLAMGLPINVGGVNNNIVISGNTITGNGQVGIQLFSSGTALIENNTFNKTTGYTYSALYIWSGTPKLRGNVFQCATAVQIGNAAGGGAATPDLGTAIDPGNNDFTAVTGASITHNTVDTVNAIGNTWPAATPACGTDIVITAGGLVIWGSTAGNQC